MKVETKVENHNVFKPINANLNITIEDPSEMANLAESARKVLTDKDVYEESLCPELKEIVKQVLLSLFPTQNTEEKQ